MMDLKWNLVNIHIYIETYKLSLLPRPIIDASVVYSEMSKSSGGLKGHMKIH